MVAPRRILIVDDEPTVRESCRRIFSEQGYDVETAETGGLFHRPLHPYTEALMSAAPQGHPGEKGGRILLPGEVADPSDLPPGCSPTDCRNLLAAAIQ